MGTSRTAATCHAQRRAAVVAACAPRLLVLSLLVICSPRAFAQTTYLLQCESPSATEAPSLGVRLVGGYESGYIPDAPFGAEIGLGLFDWLRVGLDFYAVELPQQQQLLVSSYGLSARLRLLAGQGGGSLWMYARYAHTPGEPTTIDYPGSLPDVGLVISPRRDAGMDVGGGLTGMISHRSGSALLFDAEYSRTMLRTWHPRFQTEGYRNRLFLNLVPAYTVSDTLMIGVQNRLTYWFDRGFLYDIMPQLNWVALPGLTLSVGAGAPVIGGGVWKAYASAAYRFSFGPLPPVVREERDIRMRVYFHFLGDRADLFAPQNARYGAQNERLMDKVARFIARHEGYTVVVEGHTNRARFDIPFEEEQNKEMLPLARARAAAVRQGLIQRGFEPARISVKAYGGLHPLADFADRRNNWKNRRVEILLVKEQ